jgi:hypothetical protein
VDAIVGRIIKWLTAQNAQKEVQASIKDQAAQDSSKAVNLPKDATAKETDDSIDDEFKHF